MDVSVGIPDLIGFSNDIRPGDLVIKINNNRDLINTDVERLLSTTLLSPIGGTVTILNRTRNGLFFDIGHVSLNELVTRWNTSREKFYEEIDKLHRQGINDTRLIAQHLIDNCTKRLMHSNEIPTDIIWQLAHLAYGHDIKRFVRIFQYIGACRDCHNTESYKSIELTLGKHGYIRPLADNTPKFKRLCRGDYKHRATNVLYLVIVEDDPASYVGMRIAIPSLRLSLEVSSVAEREFIRRLAHNRSVNHPLFSILRMGTYHSSTLIMTESNPQWKHFHKNDFM